MKNTTLNSITDYCQRLWYIAVTFLPVYQDKPKAICKRVKRRIECLNCDYPASESHYMLTDDGFAIEPISKVRVLDPGCCNT